MDYCNDCTHGAEAGYHARCELCKAGPNLKAKDAEDPNMPGYVSAPFVDYETMQENRETLRRLNLSWLD